MCWRYKFLIYFSLCTKCTELGWDWKRKVFFRLLLLARELCGAVIVCWICLSAPYHVGSCWASPCMLTDVSGSHLPLLHHLVLWGYTCARHATSRPNVTSCTSTTCPTMSSPYHLVLEGQWSHPTPLPKAFVKVSPLPSGLHPCYFSVFPFK